MKAAYPLTPHMWRVEHPKSAGLALHFFPGMWTMTATIHLWLWIGTIGMLIGAVLLYFAMASNKSEREEGDLVSHFYVPLIAFALYLLMALGVGSLTTSIGRVFYFGRYIDWTFTTPLLLWSLVNTGLQGTGIKRPALVWGLLGADVYMILTGFVAGLTDNMTVKWCFYITSCFAFLAVYGLLFGPFKRLTATGPNGADYMKKAATLSLLWLAYPIVFILGQEGIRYWSGDVDAIAYTILDLTAKVAYGLWAVSLAKKALTRTPDYPTTARATIV
jgi:bacteriorhodopsin